MMNLQVSTYDRFSGSHRVGLKDQRTQPLADR
jgi:hypothetical protein